MCLSTYHYMLFIIRYNIYNISRGFCIRVLVARPWGNRTLAHIVYLLVARPRGNRTLAHNGRLCAKMHYIIF